MPSRAFIVFDPVAVRVGRLGTTAVLMPSRAFIVFDQNVFVVLMKLQAGLNALAGIYCF